MGGPRLAVSAGPYPDPRCPPLEVIYPVHLAADGWCCADMTALLARAANSGLTTPSPDRPTQAAEPEQVPTAAAFPSAL